MKTEEKTVWFANRKESTVRVQLTRAREKLKAQFEEDGVLELLRV